MQAVADCWSARAVMCRQMARSVDGRARRCQLGPRRGRGRTARLLGFSGRRRKSGAVVRIPGRCRCRRRRGELDRYRPHGTARQRCEPGRHRQCGRPGTSRGHRLWLSCQSGEVHDCTVHPAAPSVEVIESSRPKVHGHAHAAAAGSDGAAPSSSPALGRGSCMLAPCAVPVRASELQPWLPPTQPKDPEAVARLTFGLPWPGLDVDEQRWDPGGAQRLRETGGGEPTAGDASPAGFYG